MFHEGQNVVCVFNFPDCEGMRSPKENEPCTISECFYFNPERELVVILKEFPSYIENGDEIMRVWGANKFVPLDEMLNEEIMELVESTELIEI